MRVCVLSEYFYPDNTGGTGAVLSTVVRRLKDLHPEVEIDVVASRNLFRGDADGLKNREDWQGIFIRRLRAPRPRKRSIRRRLGANMVFTGAVLRDLGAHRSKYDVILVVTAPPTLPLAAYCHARLTGTPYVYLVYDLYLDLALALQMVDAKSKVIDRMRNVQKAWFARAARVIVLGRCMRDFVEANYDVSNEKIDVVPIPANNDLIVPGNKDTNFRRNNNLSGFVILYAGNFARYQDLDTLLDAAKHLRHRSDVTLVFVGDGVKRAHMAQRIADEDMTNVRLLPFVPEDQLCDMLTSADVSLVTLEKGTAGLAVPSKFYNILASGRPTVAVIDSEAEIARIIEEVECGVCVEPENPRKLAQVLEDLANDPARAERQGRNARRAAEERYSLTHVAERFYTVLRNATRQSEQEPAQDALHEALQETTIPECG
jgi:glycosyltransferase involved in cell wall biosynthesis